MTASQYDVVVFGATSFVGQILAQYLYDEYGVDGKSLRWAMAGRSTAKLAEVQAKLGSDAAKIDCLQADADDEGALKKMCAQTDVVISTVGPYALYGETLVKVCAQSGTDYCDLTGEVQWIGKMIRRYEEDAKASGARIVHSCGFDSIPSDMGVHFLQKQGQARFGQPFERIKMRVKAMRGEASGGTVASMLNAVKEAVSDPAVRKEMANPYSICAPNTNGVRQPNVTSTVFEPEFDAWAAPFVMAAINTRIVHRSNYLSGHAYSKDFRYDEGMLVGKGAKGRVSGFALTMGLGGFMLASAIKPTRYLLERFVVPKPGEGPSYEAQQKGFYDLRFVGTTESGSKLKVKVTGDKDPGYGSTAKMLGQAGICLAKDVADVKGGFWTPATIFGDTLVERLEEKAGLTFSVEG